MSERKSHGRSAHGRPAHGKPFRGQGRGGRPPIIVPAEAQQQARDLWVVHQATEEEICLALSVPRELFRYWREELGWDRERHRAQRESTQWQESLGAALDEQTGKLREQSRPEQVAAVGKAINTLLEGAGRIRALQREPERRRYTLQLVRNFGDYLMQRDARLLQKVLPHLTAFAEEIARG